ncbi:hypothetical protein HK101_002754, partial [Irineochytrium annulatum]
KTVAVAVNAFGAVIPQLGAPPVKAKWRKRGNEGEGRDEEGKVEMKLEVTAGAMPGAVGGGIDLEELVRPLRRKASTLRAHGQLR